jgi:hypothetical protein
MIQSSIVLMMKKIITKLHKCSKKKRSTFKIFLLLNIKIVKISTVVIVIIIIVIVVLKDNIVIVIVKLLLLIIIIMCKIQVS